MTFFKKKAAAKTENTIAVRVLSANDVQVVSGGINPQPLPPGRRITL